MRAAQIGIGFNVRQCNCEPDYKTVPVWAPSPVIGAGASLTHLLQATGSWSLFHLTFDTQRLPSGGEVSFGGELQGVDHGVGSNPTARTKEVKAKKGIFMRAVG